jgi:hypothetical protein
VPFFHREHTESIELHIRHAAQKAIFSYYQKLQSQTEACPSFSAMAENALKKSEDSLIILAPSGPDEFVYTLFPRKIEDYSGFSLLGQTTGKGSDPFFRYLHKIYTQAWESGKPLLSLNTAFQTNRLYGWELLILPVQASERLRLLIVLATPIKMEAMLIPALLQAVQSRLVVLSLIRNSQSVIHDAMIVQASAQLLQSIPDHQKHHMMLLSEIMPSMAEQSWFDLYDDSARHDKIITMQKRIYVNDTLIANSAIISPFGDGVILDFVAQ